MLIVRRKRTKLQRNHIQHTRKSLPSIGYNASLVFRKISNIIGHRRELKIIAHVHGKAIKLELVCGG